MLGSIVQYVLKTHFSEDMPKCPHFYTFNPGPHNDGFELHRNIDKLMC